MAYEIRNYINAVSKKENLTDEINERINWANKKANCFNPTIDEKITFWKNELYRIYEQ